jgi:hypothetical protein
LRNQIGIYVGTPEECSGGNIIYWPFDKSTSIRYDVVKMELTDAQFMHFYQQKMFKDSIHLPYSYVDEAMEAFKDVHFDFSQDIHISTPNDESVSKLQLPMTAPLYETETENTKNDAREGDNAKNHALGGIPTTGHTHEITKPRSRKHKRAMSPPHQRNLRSTKARVPAYNAPVNLDLTDDTNDYIAFFHETFIGKTTVGKALHSSDSSQWIDAMRSEILLLLQHTLEPVEASGVSWIHTNCFRPMPLYEILWQYQNLHIHSCGRHVCM